MVLRGLDYTSEQPPLTKTMKTLVTCFILSSITFTSATPVSLQFRGQAKSQEDNDLSTLLQALIGTQEQEVAEEETAMRHRDVANLQGIFAVLEQVDREKANTMENDGAMSTFWGTFGKALLDKGKSILKQKYCSENHKIGVLIQKLIGDRDMLKDDDDSGEGNDQAVAELMPLFKVLENIDAKATQYSTATDYSAKAEGWLNDIEDKVEEKIRAFAKKYVC